MKSRMCEMFGIDVPIFAFSHCRDVVVEVSKAGGLGVLGMGRMSPERLKEELRWIDAHIGGKPYGIDILSPTTYADPGDQKLELDKVVPGEHIGFVRKLLDDAGVPRLPEADEKEIKDRLLKETAFTPDEGELMVEIAMQHPIRLIVNALGSPPPGLVERAHARGIKVAAMAGSEKHALRHKAAGCDFVIAVGHEAGGHTGKTTSMVLWPRVVDAVAPMPVLGAGGVGRGRQLAAALALGCEGVWCGSIWLTTAQSEVTPEIKKKLIAAGPDDSIHTPTVTGKPCRTLRNSFSEAWDAPGAPTVLPAPLQMLLWWGEGRTRVERANSKQFLTYPVGQLVGDMNAETSVRQVVQDMLNELVETKSRLDQVLE